MNSNYEWQKFEANRRVDGYRQQAEANRLAKRNKIESKESGSGISKVGFAFAVGITLFVIGFMLSGCQFGEVPKVEAKSATSNEPSMGERILFHDQLLANAELGHAEITGSRSLNNISMGERILFHDQLLADAELGHAEIAGSRSVNNISMGERILFHDQLWAKSEVQSAGQSSASSSKIMTMADRISFHDRLQLER